MPPIDTPTPTPETDPVIRLLESKTTLGNLNSMLSQIVERVEQGISTANSAAADAPISQGESIAVTFYMQSDVAQLADFLRANGGDPRNIGEDYVEAYVPISLLVRASERQGVLRVEAIIPPQPADNTPLSIKDKAAPPELGNVTSQAVKLHGADAWHAAGYTGKGVKVGIIDSGFEGFSALKGSELPANVITRCYFKLGGFSTTWPPDLTDCESHSHHGTIVAESLLDIAPDVTLYISNPLSKGDLKNTVEWMINQGVHVINYSITWGYDGPGDGTSPYSNSPLKSVDAAVRGGAIWVSSAGNDANASWFGSWTDTDDDGYMNFEPAPGGSDLGAEELNKIYLNSGDKLTAQLRWSGSWGGSDIDLNLMLLNPNGRRAAASIDFQRGGSRHNPYEVIRSIVLKDGIYSLAVYHSWGDTPDWIQLNNFGGTPLQHTHERKGSIGNPAESANTGMLTVGAARSSDINQIEPYSGRGPAPDGRTKPDITGADCDNTASIGQFCGTSQASPHVAGLAALVKQRFPDYTPEQIANYLKTNAEPRGAAVPNNEWGYGFAKLPDPQTTHHSPTPTPTRTPVSTSSIVADGRIAFSSARDGNTEIYVMNADGTGLSRLTNSAGTDIMPAWSPNGRRIAFSSNRSGDYEIYVMNADGAGVSRLTNTSGIDDLPAWSPDGRRIAFTSHASGNRDVYVMNADGSNVTRLTNHSAADTHATWSSDGNRIMFQSHRNGTSGIYVMNADGSNVTRLTTHHAAAPAWSPNGRRVAFRSGRDGDDEIYVMNANGASQTRLTRSNGDDGAPAWSPDGRHIVFHSARGGGNHNIYVMNADGSNQTRLTNLSTTDDWYADWTSGSGRVTASPTPTHTPTATPTPRPLPTRAPTATPTRAPTATPVADGQIDNRVSQLEKQVSTLQDQTSAQQTQIGILERLIATLQTLINALTGRVTALEEATPEPTATPSPTSTPSPTPTSVPVVEPPIISSACIHRIEQDSLIEGTSIAGTWTPDCPTANPPQGDDTYYAQFYTFTLDDWEEFELRITSDDRPYIYLLAGEGTGGEVLFEIRDIRGEGALEEIEQLLLQPGSYTIEVTTYDAEVTGDFTLNPRLRQ